MTDIIRTARRGDKQALQSIWKTVFGDPDDVIEAFFSHYFDPGLCVVADCGDVPAAMGYLLPMGDLISGGRQVPCAMIYAVAVLPEHRGRGFGSIVVRELISKGRDAGYGAVALNPSEDTLFEYYSARTELRDWSYMREQIFKTAPAPASACAVTLSPIMADDYILLREALLSGVPHIGSDLRAVSYQQRLCEISGGGLFRADHPGGSACLIVERGPDGEVMLKELLTDENNTVDILSVISLKFSSCEYIVRIPAPSDTVGYGTRRSGMLAAFSGDICATGAEKAAPWFGPAFD